MTALSIGGQTWSTKLARIGELSTKDRKFGRIFTGPLVYVTYPPFLVALNFVVFTQLL
jgi:hypothetical protein